MKKIVLIVIILLTAIVSFGQGLKKGNVMGFHVGTVTLAPGVTMDQYLYFIQTRVAPAFEKNYKGLKCHLVKGIKGENKDSYGFILFFKSKSEWEKYWSIEGPQPELGKVAAGKMKDVIAEWNKLGKNVDQYTTWVVEK
jgi:hypothetical protein